MPGNTPLNRTALRLSQPKTIFAPASPSPHLTVDSSGLQYAVLPVITAGLDIDQAAELEEKNVEDPSILVRTELAKRLAGRFALHVVTDANSADLTLDVRTSAWGIAGTRLRHYGAKYSGTLRVIDNRTKKVIADGMCQSLPLDGDDLPTYERLAADDAAVLKEMLGSVAAYCIDDYRTRILGLY